VLDETGKQLWCPNILLSSGIYGNEKFTQLNPVLNKILITAWAFLIAYYSKEKESRRIISFGYQSPHFALEMLI